MRSFFLLLLVACLPPVSQDEEARVRLAETLTEAGLRLDLERGVASIPVSVLVREDLLEFLLVGPRGKTHESLFVTEVTPSVLNAALLALGVAPGRNATWVPVEGEGAEEGEHRPLPPEGEGFYLYAAWRVDGETYFYRVDDLISNLESGRSMRRHRWVYLGSRFRRLAEGEPEVFIADLEQNLVNISFFFEGNTLVTSALPESIEQTIWVANAWIVPPRGSELELLFAREPLDSLPDGWAAELPAVKREASGEDE